MYRFALARSLSWHAYLTSPVCILADFKFRMTLQKSHITAPPFITELGHEIFPSFLGHQEISEFQKKKTRHRLEVLTFAAPLCF